LYGSLGILNKNSQENQIPEDPQNLIKRKKKINVKFSQNHNVTFKEQKNNNGMEEQQEELDHIRQQRALFKSFKAGKNIDENEDFTDYYNHLSTRKKQFVDNTLIMDDNNDDDDDFYREERIVYIEDFDFVDQYVTIYVGDKITFTLGNSVPMYAEHILYGSSNISSLCFESELLQVSCC
jgi:hypothetical protein